MDLSYPISPLTELTVEELRERRSMKWVRYPRDVLPLWVAEMDTPLAPAIRAVLREAVDRGDTGYAAPGRLREAFASFAAIRFGWWPDPAHMMLVADVMRGIAESLYVLTEPGDGVLVNTPAYPPFFSFIAHTGRRVVESPLVMTGTNAYHLDLDRLEADLARPEVRVYLLCNPHNPTGAVFGPPELLAIAELAARHGVRMLVDEVHAPLTYPAAPFVPYLSLGAAAASALVFVSASKAWNLAGLKTALIVAGSEAVADLRRIPEEVAYGASILGVAAAEAAFGSSAGWLDRLLVGLDANRDLLSSLLAKSMPAVGYRPPDGTYLAWLDCRALELGDDPASFFEQHARVAVNPGPSFGTPGRGFVRLNMATAPWRLAEGVRRMAASLESPR
jgi:cystathionine beta-lyase